jgi:hypothetical protein
VECIHEECFVHEIFKVPCARASRVARGIRKVGMKPPTNCVESEEDSHDRERTSGRFKVDAEKISMTEIANE